MDKAILDQYQAIEMKVEHRSGVMADIDFDGLALRIVSGFCTHPDIEIGLYYTGHETETSLTAVVVCPQCGIKHECNAALLQTPAQLITRNAKTDLIFGAAEERFQRGQGPAWGRTSKPRTGLMLEEENGTR